MNIDRHFFFASRFNFVWGLGMSFVGYCVAFHEYLPALVVVVVTAAVSVWGRRWAEGK
jgi:hypothetical protein